MFSSVRRYVGSIRNIGIIAHVDAGKTTLSERFLELAGVIPKAGSVDDKNTTLDFLPTERKRGITIAGASAQLSYNNVTINLIDLPGHIDFNIENEMAMLGIDGCICVIDSISGVQVQTEKVFEQAKLRGIPCLFFINKMDKDGVNWKTSFKSLNKIGTPVIAQAPFFENTTNPEKEKIPPPFTNVQSLLTTSHSLKEEMIDILCNFDEDLIEQVLDDKIPSSDNLNNLIRDLTIQNKINPVLFGSAKKNIGVPEILKAVIDWLPSPQASVTEQPSCIIFKVRYDNQRGFQFYTKCTSGTIIKSSELYNSRTNQRVVIQRIQRSLGKNIVDIDHIECGDIGILTGFKDVKAGDILSFDKTNNKVQALNIPSPVFFFEASPISRKDTKDATNAISILPIEDPSVSVEQNEDSWLIGCMGELHSEIIQIRLNDSYNGKLKFGPMRINAYLKASGKFESSVHHTIEFGDVGYNVEYKIKLEPNSNSESFVKPDELKNSILVENELQYLVDFVKSTVNSALDDSLENSVFDSKIIISEFKFSSNYKDNVGKFNQVLADSINLFLKKHVDYFDTYEPLMKVYVNCDFESTGDVLADISKREGEIISTEPIVATIPLRELQGYSTKLRTLSHGRGSFTATLENYRKV